MCIVRLLGAGSSTIFVGLWKRELLFLEPIDASYVLSHLSVSFSNPCPCVVIALLTASRPCQYGPSHLVSPSSILIFAPSKLFHLFTQIAPVHLTFGPWPPNKTTHSVNSCPCHRPVPSQCWTFDRNGAINHPKCFRFGNSTLMNQNPQCHNHSFQDAFSTVASTSPSSPAAVLRFSAAKPPDLWILPTFFFLLVSSFTPCVTHHQQC